MPNWVYNQVEAPEFVINALINSLGEVDFNQVLPYEEVVPLSAISVTAETAAKTLLNRPLHPNALIAQMEQESRDSTDFRALRQDELEQVLAMLKNFHKTGFLHAMEFARHRWGTKWNAVESFVDKSSGVLYFRTACSCPFAVYEALSLAFPEERIQVRFADEDIGSNCGSFTLRNGEIENSSYAKIWAEMPDEERERWQRFALDTVETYYNLVEALHY